MEKENIRTISIEDFRNYKEILDYADENCVIINSLTGIPQSNEPVRLDCFMIAICLEGCMQLDINSRTYRMQEGDLLLIMPNTVVGQSMISPRYMLRIIMFSPPFMQHIIKLERNMWNIALHIHNNPLRHIGKQDCQGVSEYFSKLIMAKIHDTPHRYRKEVLHHLFAALFCEMIGHLDREMSETQNEQELPDKGLKQADHLFRRFLEMLAKDNGMHRSVAYYADELCYSPKHLSKIIKQKCGKTAIELINERAVECIKYRLKHSDKSIKEIAEEFRFPNQSFFGKYVKSHLGMSPAQYRNF